MPAYSSGACSCLSPWLSIPYLSRDPRQPATPLRTHASTHSDDITVLHFGPENTLLSASSDGLISLSNGNEDDEDEAVVTVANWGCSVAQAGWMPGYQRIWAASDMETFGTWTSNVILSHLRLAFFSTLLSWIYFKA